MTAIREATVTHAPSNDGDIFTIRFAPCNRECDPDCRHREFFLYGYDHFEEEVDAHWIHMLDGRWADVEDPEMILALNRLQARLQNAFYGTQIETEWQW